MPIQPIQYDTKTSPVGTDIIGFSKAYPIGGVSIDNPTNSWLSVNTLPGGVFVPPLVLGWATPLAAPKASIDVRFVESPFGSPAVGLFGSPISVTIYEASVDGGPVISASAGISLRDFFGVQTTVVVLDVTETMQTTLFVPANGNYRILPFSIKLDPGFVSGPNLQLRSQCMIDVFGTIGGLVIGRLAISPESPSAETTNLAVIEQDITVNEGLNIRYQLEPGGGLSRVSAQITWYQQPV